MYTGKKAAHASVYTHPVNYQKLGQHTIYWHHTADAVTAVHSTALCSSKHQRDQRKEELECKIPTAPGPATESWFTYKWNQRTGHLTSEQWRESQSRMGKIMLATSNKL